MVGQLFKEHRWKHVVVLSIASPTQVVRCVQGWKGHMGAIEEARYCEETGAPLNDAARRIVELATQVTPVQSRTSYTREGGRGLF